MLPWSVPLQGRFDETIFSSEVLKGNLLSDPSDRPLWIYLPPQYDEVLYVSQASDDPDVPFVIEAAVASLTEGKRQLL